MHVFGVPTDEREELAQLQAASNERRPPWWHRYREVVTFSYEQIIAFEDAAESVSEFQLGLLPGLVQTEDYARAVTGVGFASLGPDQVEGLVEVRMVRQRKRLLETENPIRCHYLISQAALEFRVGGEDVYRRQLQHLLDLCDHPSLTMQVIPYDRGEEAC